MCCYSLKYEVNTLVPREELHDDGSHRENSTGVEMAFHEVS